MTSTKILRTIHETISGAHQAGVVSTVTMREFDQLCLQTTKEYSAIEIQEIRLRNKVSQSVLACYMNVTPSSIQQWERGDRRPTGASLKLLNLLDRHGLDALD